MYSQEKQFSSLAKILSNYDRVIIDTCALMDEGFPQFMDTLVGSKRYWKDGLQIITLKECVEELEKHAANKDWHYSEARIDAVRALSILKDAYRKHHVIQIAKRQQRKGDTFADPSILATATVLRIHYRVLVITQDKNLAYDLEGLNSLGSQNGRFLATMKINAGGQLEGHSLNKPKAKDFKKAENKKDKKPTLKVETKEIKETKQIEFKPVPVPKIEQKPAKIAVQPKKEEKPKESKQPKPFYVFGPTPVDAVIASAKHLNVLVRDPGVAYVKEIHGPVDITKNVLIDKLPVSKFLKTGDNMTFNVKGLKVTAEKTERDYRATTSLEPTDDKKETPKVVIKGKQPDNVAKVVEVKKDEQKTAKDEKTEPPASNKPAAKAEKPKAKPIEKTSTAKAPKEKKKPADPKQVKDKPTVDEKASEKAEPKKPSAPKKTPLEKALAVEKRLSANVSNPNYPSEKKAKDIESFIKLYDKLSDEEKKQIKLTKEFLDQQKQQNQ